jgi:hypothetical protein
MPLHKLGNIELGLLQNLHLADVAILDGEDGRCLTSDLVANGSRDKLLHEGLEVSLGSQFIHNADHLSTDRSDLCRLGVACILDLVVLRASEGNTEHADDVTISCPTVDISFNNRLLLSDQTAQLVAGHIHTVKVGKAIETLNILDTKSDLSESQSLVLVQVGEANLDNSALQTIRCNLSSSCLGNEGLAAVLDSKDRRRNELVPFFLEEGVNCLFTATLLTLRKTLILSL